MNSQKHSGIIKELLQFAIIALAVVLPFRLYIAQPFIVNGASMDPTFESGQYLIVDQISYKFAEPTRGSVIIFKYPKDTTKFFIKRIIGLPGETVRIEDGIVFIVNEKHPEGKAIPEEYVTHPKEDDFSMTLGEEEYFVMGDNRAESSDSRMWGALPKELIVGRPVVRLLPLQYLNFFPGDHSG